MKLSKAVRLIGSKKRVTLLNYDKAKIAVVQKKTKRKTK